LVTFAASHQTALLWLLDAAIRKPSQAGPIDLSVESDVRLLYSVVKDL